jgi:hypothetical protein
LLANDDGDDVPHEHDDVPSQPQGPPPMNLFNPLIPQIMNVIQQGMQADMTIFHSSYNEQYHQPVIQQFDTLNVNIGVVRSDVDSLTNQFGHLSTSVDNLLVNVMCAEACSAFQFLIFVINL